MCSDDSRLHDKEPYDAVFRDALEHADGLPTKELYCFGGVPMQSS